MWSRILAKAAAPIRGYESPRHTKFKIVNGPSRARILLVENEEKTARAIVSGLEAEGFAASWAETGEEGFFPFKQRALRCARSRLDVALRDRIGSFESLAHKGHEDARSVTHGPRCFRRSDRRT